MSLADDVAAVRSAVTLSTGEHFTCVRVGGREAHDLLDRVSPRPLFVRSGQVLHTVLLDDAALPVADTYICCDDDCYLVISEGAPVADYLRAHAGGLAVDIEDLAASHAVLSLDGPYAWELVAELTSPEVIGLPYLSFFHAPRFLCLRGGKTGEYGYDLVIERARVAEVRAQIEEVGRRFDLRVVGRDAIELCMLEAGFFNVRRQAGAGLTPIELQLQWRVAAGRAFPGSAALAERRAAPRGRLTGLACDRELAGAVTLDGVEVGRVLDAGRSYTRGDHVGCAVLALEVAHPGLVLDGGVRTISMPAVNNRSLYVDPQRHSWATRSAASFPALVRPVWS